MFWNISASSYNKKQINSNVTLPFEDLLWKIGDDKNVEVNLSSTLIIQLFPPIEWIQNSYLQNFWC